MGMQEEGNTWRLPAQFYDTKTLLTYQHMYELKDPNAKGTFIAA
jgi:hypothetical protein